MGSQIEERQRHQAQVLWLLGALLLALILTLLADPPAVTFWYELSLRALYLAWLVLLAMGVLPYCWRVGMRLGRWWAWAVVLAGWLLLMGLSNLVAQLLMLPQPYQLDGGWLLRDLLIAAVSGVVGLRVYDLQWQLRQQEQSLLRTRLQALQARIEPHFLFNTLTSISELMRLDVEAAEQAIDDLGLLLRAAISEREQSSVADELVLLEGYLRIEQHRLGPRLQYRFEVEPPTRTQPLLPLLLQPLVENAVVHGIHPNPAGGCISVQIQQRDSQLQIRIRNPKLAPSRRGQGVALDNIRARLTAAYGGAAQLRVLATDEHTVEVQIDLPWRDDAHPGR